MITEWSQTNRRDMKYSGWSNGVFYIHEILDLGPMNIKDEITSERKLEMIILETKVMRFMIDSIIRDLATLDEVRSLSIFARLWI